MTIETDIETKTYNPFIHQGITPHSHTQLHTALYILSNIKPLPQQ